MAFGKKKQFKAYVHICFDWQNWQNIAFMDDSWSRVYGRNVDQMRQALSQEWQNITQDAQL